MNALIGNDTSAKFLFFAMDDNSSAPDEKQIKQLLDTKKINVYKRHGHYSGQLDDIDNYLYLMKNHYLDSKAWNAKGFTHAVRLDKTCELNATIEMVYGHTLVACLHLDDYLMKSLNQILNDISNLKSCIQTAEREQSSLLRQLENIRQLKYLTNQSIVPSNQQVEDIFHNYALSEKSFLKIRFDDWYQLAKWSVDLNMTFSNKEKSTEPTSQHST
jgi:hypothetical protein